MHNCDARIKYNNSIKINHLTTRLTALLIASSITIDFPFFQLPQRKNQKHEQQI